jgi:hypothetical protein
MFLLVILTSCNSFHNHNNIQVLPNNIKKIYVTPFVNDTNELELEIESTNAFVDEVLSDGRISLAGTKDESDGTLYVTIKKYVVQHLTYDVNNLAEHSKLRVVVSVSFTDKNNVILWSDLDRIVEHIYNDKETVQKNDVLYFEISNEQEAREAIWENLSRNIIKRIIKTFI